MNSVVESHEGSHKTCTGEDELYDEADDLHNPVCNQSSPHRRYRLNPKHVVQTPFGHYPDTLMSGIANRPTSKASPQYKLILASIFIMYDNM